MASNLPSAELDAATAEVEVNAKEGKDKNNDEMAKEKSAEPKNHKSGYKNEGESENKEAAQANNHFK